MRLIRWCTRSKGAGSKQGLSAWLWKPLKWSTRSVSWLSTQEFHGNFNRENGDYPKDLVVIA
jgi:hypothetical protein